MSEYPDAAPARPLWLVTLADLALLLVGFFVLLQATGDTRALAGGLRQGFGGTPIADAPMPVAAAGVTFLPGSAEPQGSDALIAWARDAVRDPRVTLTIAGTTDGSAGDVDPVTGSAAVLAADRARAVAVVLAPVTRRLATLTDPAAHRRGATVTLAFTGEAKETR